MELTFNKLRFTAKPNAPFNDRTIVYHDGIEVFQTYELVQNQEVFFELVCAYIAGRKSIKKEFKKFLEGE